MEDILKQLQAVMAEYGLQVIGALATIIIGTWIAKMLAKYVGKLMRKREVDETLTKFLVSLIRIGLIIFVIISAASQVGIQTASFVAVIGAAGLAIGFALQGSLSNLAAGVMLIIFKPIKVGDFIEGGGGTGTVETVGIFVTTLVTVDNKVVYIPNSTLTGSNITNYSAKDTRRVDMVFGIGYSDDIDKAKNVIQSVINNDSRILKDPAPQVVVSELGDSSVNFNVRPWVNKADYWGVYFDTTEQIKKKFDEQNISIPFPQRDVHMYQSN
ncbi:MAG: mechanosensitive ion channel [Ignavibacteriaceae bacterium]|jgi:small conductance mechanosensitive channel|nr:mechanosensitive ion channel [Ignavibacteriaceae bacterium]MCW8813197.1 mechanosensitive ion channel [Chlorobium sp.]MCW8996032.1 mechanosensitive ion channel [Psychromonas sp.]MCW8816754.1 mechanosensitive ion channel [Ignavibacteriaceae bacterium]MCW8822715.1 mechanosensitive ion channel [Ignavibacteriaceae bacterium]